MKPPAPDLLAAIVESSDDGIVSKTLQGIITSWNSGAERIFGYTAAEAIGSHISMLFPPDRLPEEKHFLSEIGQGRRIEHFETIRVRKNGEQIPVSVTLSPLRDSSGTIFGASKIVRDISERARTEAALREARDKSDADAERLNVALAAARLGDWSWDAATDGVVLSDRAAEILGVEPRQATTWTAIRGILHPDDRERARRAVEESVATHDDYGIEYRVMSGGRERWVSASGRARYDEQGVVKGMFGVVQDITADRLLVKLDDIVRPLVEPEAITYAAAQLVGQHLDVNRCAYAVVEEDEDEFLVVGNYTRDASSIVGRHRFREFGAECLRMMRAGEVYVVQDSHCDERIDPDDRRAFEASAIRSVICVPILKAGRLVAAMAVHTTKPRLWLPHEIAIMRQVASRCWESIERARVERLRVELLEAAETANRAKDEFMAMLGHELRNPLSPILTALQLMKLRGDGGMEWERTVIERQVSHLTRLVDDLLDVSRIARGKVELKTEIVELAEVVVRAIEVASPLLEQRAHVLTLDVPRAGLPVEADPARLSQVVANLLTNAARYTPPGGRVMVSAVAEGDSVALRVRDTGVGIEADVLPRLFEPFVQGRQEMDRPQGGLGLGLTIVRNLVERHGGSVEAHSDGPGAGSEFVVRLPLAPVGRLVPRQLPLARAVEAPPKDAPRILVVDDNRDAAQMLAEALRLKGFETSVAHDGPEALRLAAGTPLDAALIDIGLPVMDGYELAARLKAMPELEDIQLVAVTGYGQESDKRRSKAAGFHHHIVKPVDLDTLAPLIAGIRRKSSDTVAEDT